MAIYLGPRGRLCMGCLCYVDIEGCHCRFWVRVDNAKVDGVFARVIELEEAR